jgi:hypothetical protein
MNYVELANRILSEHRISSPRNTTKTTETTEPLEAVLKGHSLELWSNSQGKLFLVADEEDVKAVMDRYGARRGEVYTAAEVRRIVTVTDPAAVAEIHEYKRRFEGKIRHLVDFRADLDKEQP